MFQCIIILPFRGSMELERAIYGLLKKEYLMIYLCLLSADSLCTPCMVRSKGVLNHVIIV